ncbi:MAG: hypothetical protein N3H31_03845 [Candidatus Nezhaarchaeota archaeon]|nr:hypothetical protein [Candidatus Nezhaarchaeota archaeon]
MSLGLGSSLAERLKSRADKAVPLLNVPIIFGLGSGGGRVLARLSVPKVGAIKVAINSSARDLKQIEGSVDLVVPCGDLGGSGMEPEKGREDYLEVAGMVPRLVEEACRVYGCTEPDVIVTVASLGHGFGSGSLPEHLRVIKESFPKAIQLVFAVTPFHFEGWDPLVRAFNSLKVAIKHATVFPLSNHIASLKLGGDLHKVGLDDVYSIINSRIAETLSTLFDAFTALEGVKMGMDRSDLRNIMRGELGAVGVAKYSSASNLTVERVLQDLASSIYVRLAAGPDGLYGTYIIDSGSPIPLALLNELSRELVLKWSFKSQFLKPLIIERPRQGVSILAIMTNILFGKHAEREIFSLLFGLYLGDYWSKLLAKKLRELFK